MFSMIFLIYRIKYSLLVFFLVPHITICFGNFSWDPITTPPYSLKHNAVSIKLTKSSQDNYIIIWATLHKIATFSWPNSATSDFVYSLIRNLRSSGPSRFSSDLHFRMRRFQPFSLDSLQILAGWRSTSKFEPARMPLTYWMPSRCNTHTSHAITTKTTKCTYLIMLTHTISLHTCHHEIMALPIAWSAHAGSHCRIFKSRKLARVLACCTSIVFILLSVVGSQALCQLTWHSDRQTI